MVNNIYVGLKNDAPDLYLLAGKDILGVLLSKKIGYKIVNVVLSLILFLSPCYTHIHLYTSVCVNVCACMYKYMGLWEETYRAVN